MTPVIDVLIPDAQLEYQDIFAASTNGSRVASPFIIEVMR